MGDRTVIDLNADVGEGFDEDAALLAVVTSANVACGFHAGDASTMEATCERARARASRSARTSVIATRRASAVASSAWHRRAGRGDARAARCAGGVRADGGRRGPPRQAARRALPPLRARPRGGRRRRGGDRGVRSRPAGRRAAGVGTLAAAGSVGLTAVAEGFADRGYGPDGGLVARDEPGAVLGAEAAAAQAVELALGRRGLAVQTLCVHGDTPGAAALARTVRAALEEASVTVVAPA
jgi:UPF0271 protein